MKAQRDSAPLRTGKHSAGLVKQPEKLLLGAAQARRSRIDRHRLAASTIHYQYEISPAAENCQRSRAQRAERRKHRTQVKFTNFSA